MKTKFVIFIAIFAVLSSLFVLPSFADDSASDVDLTQYNTFTFNETVASLEPLSFDVEFTVSGCSGLTFSVINIEGSICSYYSFSSDLSLYVFDGLRVFSDPELYVLYFDSIDWDSYSGLLEFGTFSYTDFTADPESPSDPEADTPVKTNWYNTLYDIIHNGIYGGEELDSDQTFMCSFLATILCVLTFCFPFFLLFFILKLILST